MWCTANRNDHRKCKGLPVLVVGVFYLLWTGLLASPSAGQAIQVGGACQYKVYPGQAEIVSVEPVTVSGVTKAAIRFVYRPHQPLPETWAQFAHRSHPLTMVNGTDPSIKFMEKYGLEMGRVLRCHLKLITKGTCTPAIFDFPEVDRTDYHP